MTTVIILGIALGWLVAAGAFAIGWQRGRRHGRDEQWVDDCFAQWKAEAERRDAQGRFRRASR